MRELKFRAWHKPYNEMCEVASLWFNYDGTLRTVVIIENMFNDQKVVKADDVIVEQHTGLKDKNGKEIYEGDILKWKCHREIVEGGVEEIEIIEKIAKVYWEEGDASFVVGHWLRQLGRLVNEDKNEAEVIGNIHENPELLERKK